MKFIKLSFGRHTVEVLLDSGAESNLIEKSVAERLGATVYPNTEQAPSQADGRTKLQVVGETHLLLSGYQTEFQFDALVIKDIGCPAIAGIPFLSFNDVTLRPKLRSITLANGRTIAYGEVPARPIQTAPKTRRVHMQLVRGQDKPITVWPGDSYRVEVEDPSDPETLYMVEPRFDTARNHEGKIPNWPEPACTTATNNIVSIPNHTAFPVVIKPGDHLCSLTTGTNLCEPPSDTESIPIRATTSSDGLHIATVSIDPDSILPPACRGKLASICREYDDVFDVNYPGYNGASGKYSARVNMGPTLPPQRKG